MDWLSVAFGFVSGFVFTRFLPDLLSQRRVFDHRLRLEKEYEIYTALWSAAFDFRRACAQIIEPLSTSPTSQEDDEKKYVEAFNHLQSVVRRAEPFLPETVWKPARTIVTLGWDICSALRAIKAIESRRAATSSIAEHEKLGEDAFQEDEKTQEALKTIATEMDSLRDSIRARIMLRRWPVSESWPWLTRKGRI